MPFADGTSTLRWGGVGGRRHEVNATDVSVRTKPRGPPPSITPPPTGLNPGPPLGLSPLGLTVTSRPRPRPRQVGTTPAGSTWRRSPLPRGPWDWRTYGPSPEPVCDEPAACTAQHTHPDHPANHSRDEGAYPCECSGSGVGDLYNLEVLDKLRLPASLAPGEWVLGWRWDCEESTQVWASCSDVTIAAASSVEEA